MQARTTKNKRCATTITQAQRMKRRRKRPGCILFVFPLAAQNLPIGIMMKPARTSSQSLRNIGGGGHPPRREMRKKGPTGTRLVGAPELLFLERAGRSTALGPPSPAAPLGRFDWEAAYLPSRSSPDYIFTEHERTCLCAARSRGFNLRDPGFGPSRHEMETQRCSAKVHPNIRRRALRRRPYMPSFMPRADRRSGA